jgi:light-regulated signal transduction histidine kinase (bacteriophytochrome)
VRTGQPDLMPTIPDELLVAAAQDDEHLALLRSLELHSALVVPLRTRDRTLGAITLVSSEPGRYSQADLPLLEDVAHRAATAIDNARLYRVAREAEAALRQLNAELERRVAERTAELQAANKELEAFAYSVSHDLRAPLRSLDGFSQILVQRYGDALDEAGQRYLAHVRGAAQDMGQLIDALLRLARTTRAQMHREQLDLRELGQAVVAELVRADPERAITITIGDGLIVDGDRQLLRVVLENLLGNAWKFTRQRDDSHIEIGRTEDSGRAVYFVHDNGAGFDMQYADKLFGAFQRLHSAAEFEGLGIGLATVQRIIHRHGGQVWAEGKEGEGATFYFTLGSSLEEHHGQ